MTEPEFVATAAGADEAVQRGNRRRRRSAATAAAVLLAAGGVVVAAPWQAPAARDSLVPARDPLPSPSPSPTAGTTAAPVTGSRTSSHEPTRAPAGPAGRTAPGAAPTAAAPARRTASPATRASSPITRGTSTIAAGDLCAAEQSYAAQGWCLRYTGPATARRGRPVALSAELCRLASFPAATLTFASTREVLLDVQGTGWQAGQGERFTSPGRTVTVAGGSCLTWASTWDTRDADGFLVVPGSYAVDLGLEASSGMSTSGTLQVSD